MDESAGNRPKICVDNLKSESKTCLIHNPEHYSNECKVLGDFGTKYAKGKRDKDHNNNLVPRKNSTDSNKTTLLLTILWTRSYWMKPKK